MGGGAIMVGDGGRSQLYTGKTTPAVIIICLVAASGGLLFGFDNGITGGVTSMEGFQEKFFPSLLESHPDQTAFCKYNDHTLQLFTSSLFIAGAVAALIGSWISRRFGRRITMTCGGICFSIGTVLVACAVATPMLVIGRVILGFGVGFATQATPLYLSEMAPYNLRGALNIMFQLAVTIGIFAAQLINYGTQHIQPWGWRLSLALGGVPAVILLIGSLLLPDTPNSLVQRGKPEEGRKVLQRVRGVEDVDVEFEDIQMAVQVANSVQHPFRNLLMRKYRPQLVITILIPIFQQFTGINAIMFYAPQLFQSLGSGSEGSLLSTVIIGAVNVVSTFVAIIVVDRLGRKVLFLEGGGQMLAAEIIVGVLISQLFIPGTQDPKSNSWTIAVIFMICVYVAGFAWSWGPLGWLVPSEIQPLETRAAGTAVNTSVNFLMTFVIGQCFLSMLCSMEFGVFFFFGGFVLLMTIFVFFFVPETKDVPIEELSAIVFPRHWFWGRVLAKDGDVTPRSDAGEVEKTPELKVAQV